MRLKLTAISLCFITIAIASPAAFAADNKLAEIKVEEGPNNTVITIVGSQNPTFTVFKLLDPVRLLVDVAGGVVSAVSGTVQVRNGVVHDIESIQFKRGGRQIGRMVIGFDNDAPYSVKSSGNKIRIVIDGTDRRLPTLESEQTKEALQRAQKALQAEKTLRTRLEEAREREAKLSIERASANAERQRLADKLNKARGEVAQLREMLAQKRVKLTDKVASEKALQTKRALDEASALARAKVKALALEKDRLIVEKTAIDEAVKTAEKRRLALKNALAVEEKRRKVAERARLEEEALAKTAKSARIAEEKRAGLAIQMTASLNAREKALEAARKQAHQLKTQRLEDEKELASLRAQVKEGKILATKGQRSSKQVNRLQAQLKDRQKASEKHIKKLGVALKRAEAHATNKERMHQQIVAELKTAETSLQRQLFAREQALSRSKAATKKAREKLVERDAVIAELQARETARITAEQTAMDARDARLKAQKAVKMLVAKRRSIQQTVKRLEQEKQALDKLVDQRRRGAKAMEVKTLEKTWLKEAIAKRRSEVEHLTADLKSAELRKLTLDKEMVTHSEEVAKVRALLVREKEDLAAVLQQKALFSKSIASLHEKNAVERERLKLIGSQLVETQDRIKALKSEASFQKQLVTRLDKERESLAEEVIVLNDMRESEEANLARIKKAKTTENNAYKAAITAHNKVKKNLQDLQQRGAAESWRVEQLAKLYEEESEKLAYLNNEKERMTTTVAQLKAKIGSLKKASAVAGDLPVLRRMLSARTAQLAQLKAELVRQKALGSGAGNAGLKLALKRARAQAKKSKAGRKELKRLKRFIQTQRQQIARLKKKNIGSQVKRQSKEVAYLKAEVARLISTKSSSVQLANLRGKSLRNELLAERKRVASARRQVAVLVGTMTKSEKKLKTVEAKLQKTELRASKYQKQLAVLQTKLGASIKGAQLTALQLEKTRAANIKLERVLKNAKRRIAGLIAQRNRAVRSMAKLEKDIDAGRSAAGTRKLKRRLKKTVGQVKRLTAAIQKERALRQKQGNTADRQIELVLSQKVRLERKVDVQQKNLARLMKQGDSAAEKTAELRSSLKHHKAQVAELQNQLASAKANKGLAQKLNNTINSATKLKKALSQARQEQQLLRDELMDERIMRAKAERQLAVKKTKKSKKVARITNVAFRERNNISRIEIELDGKADYELVEKTDQRIVLKVDKVRIPKFLERRLDTSDFYGPIRMITTYTDPQDPKSVRIVVDLANAVANQLKRQKNRLIWDFQNGTNVHMGQAVASKSTNASVQYEPTAVGGEWTPGSARNRGARRAPPGGQVVPGGGLDFGVLNPYPRKRRTKRYKGQKISLTIKDADIREVLAFLAKEGGVNIIAGESVSGSVTLHLKDVPWDLALDMILKSKGLDYVVQDSVYRVAPVETIQKEFEREVEKRKKMTELKRLVVKLVTVNYAKAETLKARIKEILSKKGTVGTDSRTNTLIIKDIEEHVIAAEDLVRRLDTETPQVLIEARIVEASSNFSQEMGIQWGGNYVASPAFGNETGLIFPGILGLAGAADDGTSPLGGLIDDTPNFAVNLPAAVGGGKGGGIGLSLGTLSGSGNLSLRLTAAEERGTVKIISSPRIATLDNKEATIQQGISIPISVVSSLGVNTQFFSAQLKLQVVPHVTQDGNVALKLQITKNEPNFSQTGASGAPTIERKEAKTELLVRDGDTAVIGGIYTRNAARSFKKVPFLGDIPFLGWLFKSSVHSDKRSELLLFVTPRIINRSASRVRVD